MGDNITFGANRGHSDGDVSAGPFSILEPRVLFRVAESASEYGDGTLNPMKVTAAELFEVVYGVRDAWFTAGTADFGFTGVGTYYSLAVTLIDPLEPLTAGAQGDSGAPLYDPYEWTYTRGYCVVSDEAPHASVENYFQASYNTYTYPYGYTALGGGYYSGGDFYDCYDIADREAGMWLFSDDSDAARFTFNAPAAAPGMVTAFSHINSYFSLTLTGIPYDTVYGIYALESVYGLFPYSLTQVFFSRVVVIADNTGSGNPYDPGNDLYLGVRFYTDYAGIPYGGGWLDTYKTAIEDVYATYYSSPGEAYDPGLKFKLNLKASTVECTLYAGFAEGPGEASSWEGGTDWEMTAKKWWAYQKQGGGDMYNTSNGVEL